MQISFVRLSVLLSVLLLLSIIIPINASYHNYPSYGFSYVDSSGQFINVKFGSAAGQLAASSSNTNINTNYDLSNLIPSTYERKLFTPATKNERQVLVTDGQVEEYMKFLKEAAEEDAKEAAKRYETTSQAYVSVKLGNKSYNYQY